MNKIKKGSTVRRIGQTCGQVIKGKTYTVASSIENIFDNCIELKGFSGYYYRDLFELVSHEDNKLMVTCDE